MLEDEGIEYIVVFRRWRAHPRNVVALFPGIRASLNNSYCLTCEKGGRRDEANYGPVIRHTTTPVHPSSSRAAAALQDELERLGFRLKVATRRPPALTAICRSGLTRGVGKSFDALMSAGLERSRRGASRGTFEGQMGGRENSKTYRVAWEIDIEAASPVEAAREALRIQRKGADAPILPDDAVVFLVNGREIDLADPPSEP